MNSNRIDPEGLSASESNFTAVVAFISVLGLFGVWWAQAISEDPPVLSNISLNVEEIRTASK